MTINPQFLLSTENGTYPQLDLLNAHRVHPSVGVSIEPSSWNTVDVGNGFYQESFILFYSAVSTSIQANIKLLENYFTLAHELHVSGNPNERVVVTLRNKDESESRQATIIGGTITLLPETVATRDLKRDAVRVGVTIDRYQFLEYSTPQTHAEKQLAMHGGTITLPTKFSQGIQPGRIKLLRMTPNGHARIKKFWCGIKPAYTTLDSVFDPEIEITQSTSGVIVNTDVATWVSDSDADTGFIGGEAVQVNWTTSTDWAEIYYSNFAKWNSSTGYTNAQAYHGKYHLVMRYRTSVDGGETYGIRAGYGWFENYDTNQMEPVYVESTGGQSRYIDLGIINIAASGFDSFILDRVAPDDFRLSMHATVLDNQTDSDGNNTSYLYLDNLWLVPADHYVYAEYDSQIGGEFANKRGEVYQLESGAVHGYVVARDDTDEIGDGVAYVRPALDIATDISYENWGMPTAEKSMLVFVADSMGSTLYLGAEVNLDLNVATRTVGI